jgi:putative glycerol-1-phosphate prenyltransferase
VIFPGSADQIDEKADAILFLNLISGRNPDFLIGQQVSAAPKLMQSDLEIVPTAYLLIDGGLETSVQRISKTSPISQEDYELALNTALAGVMMGNSVVYLDAGSGAKLSIPSQWIQAMRNCIDCPIIVGGGIRNIEQIKEYQEAGASLVVIGNHLESNPSFLEDIAKFCGSLKGQS